MDEADRMPCPPDFIAASAIVALGAIIGARCAIKPKARDAWLIVPNLWGGIVGLPSVKKSPAINAALKPLERLIGRAMEEYQEELVTFEGSKTVFEARKEAIEHRIKAAAKDAEKGDLNGLANELQTHRQEIPESPTLRRYKTNDTTVEKLGELLRQNPAGLLVTRDELVGLIASWDREGREGERAFYLEAWNGNASFDTDRIGRGSIFIPNLCVSVFGGIQPDKLTAYLEHATNSLANDGMLQRFQLLVYPDQRVWEWRDRAPLSRRATWLSLYLTRWPSLIRWRGGLPLPMITSSSHISDSARKPKKSLLNGQVIYTVPGCLLRITQSLRSIWRSSTNCFPRWRLSFI
jgi:hypothetical protein